MHTGMLWFDNNPKTTLEQKIARAAEYYKKKYGRDAELCLVNPASIVEGSSFSSDGLTIRPYRPVLPGHLWIGIEDATDLSQPKGDRDLE